MMMMMEYGRHPIYDRRALARKNKELECGPMLNAITALPSAEYRWSLLFNAIKFG